MTQADRDRMFDTARAYTEWRDAGPHPIDPDDEDYVADPAFTEFMLALIHITSPRSWYGAGGIARLIVALDGRQENP